LSDSFLECFCDGIDVAGVRLYRKAGNAGEAAIARDDLSRKAPPVAAQQ
jgi:hypothetical protein